MKKYLLEGIIWLSLFFTHLAYGQNYQKTGGGIKTSLQSMHVDGVYVKKNLSY